MGKTIMGAVVSLDGLMADDHDEVGPLFDWYGNGDVAWSFVGSDDESRSTQASADFMRTHYKDIGVVVIGRRVFDLTNGWDGKPAAGEHVFVVTHEPPASWEHAGTAPFTFVNGVEAAIRAAQEYADDRVVDVAVARSGVRHCGSASSTRSSSISFPWCSARAVRSSRPVRCPSRSCSTTLRRSFPGTA